MPDFKEDLKGLQEYINKSETVAIGKGSKPFGKDFNFYISDADIIYAIDNLRNEYLCGKKIMIPVSKGTIDPFWGGVDCSTVLDQINYYTDCNSVRFPNNKKEELIKQFDSLKVFISPYGTIGGYSLLDNKDEYIFSNTKGKFTKVSKNQGYSRDWKECSKEVFLKKAESVYDSLHTIEFNKKWSKGKHSQNIIIENLDLYIDKKLTVYGILPNKNRDKVKKYKLSVIDGEFKRIKSFDVEQKRLEKCPIYAAYEIQNGIKSIENNDIPMDPANLNMFINKENDIIGIARTGIPFQYVLSYGSGDFVLLKNQILFDSNKWQRCSENKLKEIQSYIKDVIDNKHLANLENLDLYISKNNDILGYAPDGRTYVLAPEEGSLFEVFNWELDTSKWEKCSLERAKEIQNEIIERAKEEDRRIKEAEERDYGDGSWYVSVWEYKDSIKYSNDPYTLDKKRREATIARVTDFASFYS